MNANEKITNGATLWETGKHGSFLWVRVSNGGYDWIMTSEKTGSHLIKQIGGIKPEMTERVKAHWEGFQINQLRK